MNRGKGSVIGQLIPVEHTRLTISETCLIDEPAGGYMEMMEYRNSDSGHLSSLENKSTMECYLEEMVQGTKLKQKAYGTLVSSEMHAETMDQLVSLPWRAVVLRHFEEEMRATPKIHALIAIHALIEKLLLMTSLKDLMMTQEGAAVACAKRKDALCFVRFMIEQISVPALNTCAKMLREDSDRAKTLLSQALLDTQQSKPMRVNMKEPVELEPMKKVDELRRLSNKELSLTKKSMGALTKSSEYCGPIRKKSYIYVSGVVGMAYNLFINEDIRDCFFDYEQAVLLRFWLSRIATIRSAANQQAKLGFILEEKVTAPSMPKSDNHHGFRFLMLIRYCVRHRMCKGS